MKSSVVLCCNINKLTYLLTCVSACVPGSTPAGWSSIRGHCSRRSLTCCVSASVAILLRVRPTSGLPSSACWPPSKTNRGLPLAARTTRFENKNGVKALRQDYEMPEQVEELLKSRDQTGVNTNVFVSASVWTPDISMSTDLEATFWSLSRFRCQESGLLPGLGIERLSSITGWLAKQISLATRGSDLRQRSKRFENKNRVNYVKTELGNLVSVLRRGDDCDVKNRSQGWRSSACWRAPHATRCSSVTRPQSYSPSTRPDDSTAKRYESRHTRIYCNVMLCHCEV